MTNTPKISITKRFEFDSAHRLPNHEGLCRNIHGHRYAVEVSLKGPVSEVKAASDEGMVFDFAEVKSIVSKAFLSQWDHALLIFKEDSILANSATLNSMRVVYTDYVPTAENMAVDIFQRISDVLKSEHPSDVLTVERVRLYETATSWVDVSL